jgi:hypothetical protein
MKKLQSWIEHFLVCLVLAILPENSFSQACPSSDSSLREIQEWAQSVDRLSNQFLPEAGIFDYRTSVGAVLDSSCRGATERASFLASLGMGPPRPREEVIESALVQVIAQTEECRRVFPSLPNIDSVVGILRRARIACTNDLGHGTEAVNDVLGIYRPFLSALAPANTGYDRSYSFLLSNNALDNPLRASDLSVILFHEALHSLSANNTYWHNEAGRMSLTVCEASVFRDRVYFLSAVCFPESSIGRAFWADDGAASCDGVCERALTHVVPVPQLRRATEDSASEGMHGPPLSAIPMASRDAQIVCGQIRDVQGRFRRTLPLRDQAQTRLSVLRQEARVTRDFELYDAIDSISFNLSAQPSFAINAEGLPEDLADLERSAEQVRSRIRSYCSSRPVGEVQPLCSREPAASAAAIESVRAWLRGRTSIVNRAR